MKEGGMLQLEAAICLACFLAAMGTALHTLNQANAGRAEAENALEAKKESLACAATANSMYSNGVEEMGGTGIRCLEGGKGRVESVKGEKRKGTTCLPQEVKAIQAGNTAVVWVKLSEHYR